MPALGTRGRFHIIGRRPIWRDALRVPPHDSSVFEAAGTEVQEEPSLEVRRAKVIDDLRMVDA